MLQQEAYVSNEEYLEAKNYWLDKLENHLENLELIYDFNINDHEKENRVDFQLDLETCKKLIGISRGHDLLVYVVAVAVLKVLLYKYTCQNIILTGSPLYATSDESYNLNQYVIFSDKINKEMTFKDVLEQVRNSVVNAYKNQHYPMDEIFKELKIEDGNPYLYKVIAIHDGIHKKESIDGLAGSSVNDITLIIGKRGELIGGSIVYNNSRFKHSTIQCLVKCYKLIFKQAISNINMKVSDISLVDEQEKQKLLYEFNKVSYDIFDEKTVVEAFEDQIESTPNNIALVFENNELTYRELGHRVNCVARVLKHKGVKPDTVVAIITEYSIEMIVGILGILKSGGAYLPIDSNYPSERIEYMLKDTGADILLTQKKLLSDTLSETLPVKEIILLDDYTIYSGKYEVLESSANPQNLAYVIYTSGSLGKPKGVMIEHRSLYNFIKWRIANYGFNEKDVILQLLSMSFDGFGTNMYSSLLSGGTLVMPGSWRKGDFKHINRIIRERKVTNMSVVPSLYKMLLEADEGNDLSTLRCVVLAGEKSSQDIVALSRNRYPNIRLINEYGPTENTIATTAYTEITSDTVSIIGKPIAGSRVFILNKDNDIMPVGIPGELCVSGPGLARGYLNEPEITKQKFLINPYFPGIKMYRTGDIARWLDDGNIEFMGRSDLQVKIRGYRVELREVEEAIIATSLAEQAVVQVKEDTYGNNYLCAYLAGGKKNNTAVIRDRLKKLLPEYMLPSRFIWLDRMPVTINNKIDRMKLPDPEEVMPLNEEYANPRTETEKKLAEIWCQVLNCDKVSVNSSFFDVGGNSMLLMKLANLVNEAFPNRFTITDFFTHPTIEKQAHFIDAANSYNLHIEEMLLSLPQDFVADSIYKENKYIQYKFSINNELYESVRSLSRQTGIGVEDLLMAAYAYLLAGICDVERVTFPAMVDVRETICLFTVDFSQVNSLKELISTAKDGKLFTVTEGILLEEFKGAAENSWDNRVLPFFCKTGLYDLNTNLMEIFDIVFEYANSGYYLEFLCKFKTSKLKEDKAKVMITRYLGIVNYIVNNYMSF